MQSNHMLTIKPTARKSPPSFSLTKTQSIRVAIIYAIAPIAIFFNGLFDNMIGATVSTTANGLMIVFVISLY